MLVEIEQNHLFEHWPEQGVDDDEKRAFFDQVLGFCCVFFFFSFICDRIQSEVSSICSILLDSVC